MPPVVVVYGFALRFLDATIDNWFDVKLEQALDNALEIGRIVIDERLRVAERSTVDISARLDATPANELQSILDDEIDELGATQLAVFSADGRVIAIASSDPRYLDPPLPDATMQMRVQGNGRYAEAEPIGDTLMLRVAVPVGSDVPSSRRLLQGLYPLPTRLQTLTRGIENASFDFQRLKFLRGSLKLTFALILTFALLLSALLVTLAAFGVARRLVAPLGRLIAATRAVGAGRYDTPLPIASNDEVGFLVNSFGQMTREIEFASARAQRSAQETEQQRAWLVALLERLSAGVLGFDHEGRLRIANRAAEAILGVSTATLSSRRNIR